MYAVSMIVIFNVILYTYFTNGQRVALSFNTSVYGGTNDYYAHIGENVTLTCTVPAHTVAYMYKGSIFSEYEILVEYGEPVEEVTQQDKYSFQSRGRRYSVTIHNLSMEDSSPYRCWTCVPLTYWCGWPLVVHLKVKELTDDSQTPDFCELVNNTDGIFFTGDDLILRCPQLSLNFETSDGRFEISSDDFENEDHGSTFKLLTISELTPDLNGTMLSCFSVQDGRAGVGKDYCKDVPTILVFNNITIMISGGERPVINGENVTFTCHSHPFLPFSIQWNILENDVTFDNFLVSEISQGSRITFSNVEFFYPFSSSLTVSCNVTIGREKKFEMVSVYPRMQHVSTTHETETSLISEISSTHIISGTTMSITEFDRSINPVYIIIPVIIVVGILVIIILGLVYIKLRKPFKSNEDLRNTSVKQDVANGTENAYYTRNNKETQLGLTCNDSEVLDNVAYVSYDDNKQS